MKCVIFSRNTGIFNKYCKISGSLKILKLKIVGLFSLAQPYILNKHKRNNNEWNRIGESPTYHSDVSRNSSIEERDNIVSQVITDCQTGVIYRVALIFSCIVLHFIWKGLWHKNHSKIVYIIMSLNGGHTPSNRIVPLLIIHLWFCILHFVLTNL